MPEALIMVLLVLLVASLAGAMARLAGQKGLIRELRSELDTSRWAAHQLRMELCVSRGEASTLSAAMVRWRAAAPQTPQKATPRFTAAMAGEVMRQMLLLAPGRLPGLRADAGDYGHALRLTVEENGWRWMHRFQFDNGVDDTSLIDAYRALGEEKFLSAIAGAAAESLARYIDKHREGKG